MHRAEHWRERLLAGGDDALGELLAEHPGADRQQLRQLVRNALDERAKNKPPRAFRELYRAVLALLGDESEII
jgi:ribosome-associated protein